MNQIFVGVPVLNRLDLLERCIRSIDIAAELVVINNNSIDNTFISGLAALANSLSISILNQQYNLGVSASWNLIIRTAISRGFEWVFIGSNDTFLRAGSLQAAISMPKDPNIAIYHLHYYNFFLLKASIITEVGWFDENFYPAYKEDQDYSYRCALAQMREVNIDGASAEHFGSATIRSNPHYYSQNMVTHLQWNQEYYVRKWGGEAGNELYQKPFNDQSVDHRWWPDPGESIALRDWDAVYRRDKTS